MSATQKKTATWHFVRFLVTELHGKEGEAPKRGLWAVRSTGPPGNVSSVMVCETVPSVMSLTSSQAGVGSPFLVFRGSPPAPFFLVKMMRPCMADYVPIMGADVNTPGPIPPQR